MYYAAIDIGTSKIKLVVFKNDKILIEFSKEQSVIHDSSGDYIDADEIINNVFYVLKEAFLICPFIEGIAITSFGESFVCLDEKDDILFQIPLFIDESGREEIKVIKDKIGEKKLFDITGCPPDPMYSLTKILSLRNKYPTRFPLTKKIMLIEDYVIYMLTGNRFIDYGLACRSMMFDINKKDWSEEILNSFDINREMLSTCVPTGHIAGALKINLKEKLNISHDVKIINGSHDQIAVAIASDVKKNQSALGLGTCECLIVDIDIKNKEKLLKENLPIVSYKDGQYLTYGLINNAGSLIDYFSKLLDIKLNDLKVSNPKDDGFIITNIKGGNNHKLLININFATKKSEIMNYLFESLSFELNSLLEYFKSLGISFDEILASGGSSVNTDYLKEIAAICNVNILQANYHNVGLIGTGIIAGTSLGYFNNYEEGYKRLNRVNLIENNFIVNNARYQKYINLKRKLENNEL